MHSLDCFAQAKLDGLERGRLLRRLSPTHRLDGVHVERDGRRMISFSCNDYLGLSQHPAVKAAARAAIETYGAGAGASRLITGDHPLIEALEQRLAALKGAEAACVFGSGYMANAGIIPTLVGPGDLIVADALSHACIWAGAKLSDAEVVSFRHNDLEDLGAVLARARGEHRHALVATESVFSMDGDRAPLAEIAAICAAHDAWLLVDDAHGLGVIQDGGDAEVALQMGTLSKALGGYGGYLCASRPVIALMKTWARTLVYTTGLPPASAAAALAALEVMADDPALCARPLRQARRFTDALGLPAAESAIVPIIVGEPEAALDASRRLEAAGFLVVAIRPPTVPQGRARLRVAFAAGHSDDDVDRLAAAVRSAVPA